MHANDRPFVLGLTGGIATGKTTAALTLRSLGARIIDADEISRSLTSSDPPTLSAIRAAFGEAVFHEDGSLNRRALADIVFRDAARRRRLEAIVHPRIKQLVLDAIDEARRDWDPLCVLCVPLLYESGMDALCDRVWVTVADSSVQIQRVMKRDALSREQARARIDSQMPREERERRADLLLQTDRPPEDTVRELTARYEELLRCLAGARQKGCPPCRMR